MNELALSDRLKWVAVTIGVAAVAISLSFVLWRTPPGVATPPPNLLPFFLPIGVVIPALAFGFGVAFLLFGWRLLRVSGAPDLSRAAYISIGWLLINWWPHSNFHRVANGWMNIVVVDYVFHTTVIIATCVVAAFFLRAVRVREAAAHPSRDTRDNAFASSR
jgi:hypothetical protein